MSLVYCDIINETPVLFGDILISLKDTSLESISIPTVYDIRMVMTDKAKGSIQGYLQKLILIRDDVLVGWVGSVSGAQIACSELEMYLPKEGTQKDELLSTLGCTLLESEQHTRMLIWICSEKPMCYLWDSNSFDEITEIIPPYTIGSGKQHVNALLEARRLIRGEDSFGPIITSIGNIISYEIIYGTNLNDLWGGAIQAFYYCNNKFQQFIDYYLFVFFVDEKSNGNFKTTLHPYIFRPTIHNKSYILQRIDWHKKNTEYFFVENILEFEVDDQKIEYIPPNSIPKYCCFSGIFHHYQGGDSPISFAFPLEGSEEYLKVEMHRSQIVFDFSMRLFRIMIEACKVIQKESKK